MNRESPKQPSVSCSLKKYLISWLYVLELHPNCHWFKAAASIRVCWETYCFVQCSQTLAA